ncbi:hypothetical protein QWI17_20525 [Gilvimarinus sp. SDUM040013]|nr:hypothetical protein [Gilvimarinus sp. SDUM040013]MDO3388244.1 hypothetical protein [Gilvimarinus sp. SDUM040013]
MKNDIAKAISISSVWISIAIIFAFGIFDFNWTGGFSIIIMTTISVCVLLAAWLSTRSIVGSGDGEKSVQ